MHNASMILKSVKAYKLVKKKRSVFISLWKMFAVFAYALKTLGHILWRFDKFEVSKRQALLQQSARELLQIMGVVVEQQGQPLLAQGSLRASNHVSWLDMVVLYACSPCRFIAKSEVKSYPLIGHLASNAGTLFLKRGNVKDAIRMSEVIGEALQEGDCVAFFPEGTTSDGEGLLPLHASLFEGAIQSQAHVQTVVLRFHTPASMRACKDVAYVERNMVSTLWHILRHDDIIASLTGMEPFKVQQNDERRQVCARVQAEMDTTLNQLNYSKLVPLSGTGKITYEPLKEGQLRELFFTTAPEWLQSGKQGLKSLTKKPSSKDAFIRVRQSFHLLKGGADMAGLTELGLAATLAEKRLDTWKSTKKPVEPALLEYARGAFADLGEQLEVLKQRG